MIITQNKNTTNFRHYVVKDGNSPKHPIHAPLSKFHLKGTVDFEKQLSIHFK